MEFPEERRQVRVVRRVQVRIPEVIVVFDLLMHFEAAAWTVAFLRTASTEVDHPL